jgi:hypothetical protein
MKRIFIGSFVGALVFFGFQSAMWMSGVNEDFTSFTGRQTEIMNSLSQNLTEDGLYTMPITDPAQHLSQEEREKIMNANIGKPWAMIFYHSNMNEMDPMDLLRGLLFAFVACFLASLVLYHGGFYSFNTRFLTAMAFAAFALFQGALNNMNWWDFPWSFVRPQVMDLTIGWGVTSIWLAYYVKKK